jgi:hypothetical protein
MNELPFVKYLFDRPLDAGDWYFDDTHEDFKASDLELVVLATRVFETIGTIAQSFGEEQVCTGLRYVINPSCGPIAYLYADVSIDASVRLRAISAMKIVFSDLFAAHLSGAQPFRSTSTNHRPYASLCYMWWDLIPRHGVPRKGELDDLDRTIMATLASILEIDNAACQESALHGLGHWHSAKPDEVFQIVSGYERRSQNGLREYAGDAMRGNVQ